METDLAKAMGDLDEDGLLQGVRSLLDRGVAPLEILAQLQEGMAIVGRRFEAQEYFLSELVFSADIFKKAAESLGDLSTEGRMTQLGTLVIGTVAEDIHDIGKNLVTSLMSCNGFNVYDLGVDVPAQKFADAIKEHKPDFVGLSCLLTSAYDNMKKTVQVIEQAGLRKGIKILVGGGPVDETVRHYVNADYCCLTAQAAVDLCKGLMKGGAA